MTRPDPHLDEQVAADAAEMTATFEEEALNVSMAAVTLAQGRQDWPAAEHWAKVCGLLEVDPRR
jgi:hypothetical protein